MFTDAKPTRCQCFQQYKVFAEQRLLRLLVSRRQRSLADLHIFPEITIFTGSRHSIGGCVSGKKDSDLASVHFSPDTENHPFGVKGFVLMPRMDRSGRLS